MNEKKINLEQSWLDHLGGEFKKPYMHDLRAFLISEKKQGKVIYPATDLWFNAMNSIIFDQVKVVILGQDPYHGPSQAHGLCFSVTKGVRFPPSLKNIFKEIERDLGIPMPEHGCLQNWAEQGVLLLNSTLTVEQAKAGSHQKQGWEQFTDAIIRQLNDRRSHLVFVLWGGYAQKKGQLLDSEKHKILTAPHPSPLSAYRGFLGCNHFSEINKYLIEQDKTPIDWQLK